MPPPTQRRPTTAKKYRQTAATAAARRRKQESARKRKQGAAQRRPTSSQRPSAQARARRPTANLNQRLQARHMASLRRGDMYLKVAFDPTDIVNLIVHAIKMQKTHSVVGCVAWLSHQTILKTLATKPCSIVVTKDRANARKHVKNMYAGLTPADAGSHRSIKYLGAKAGRVRTNMHHKFLCGRSESGQPLWVLTGSFNMSSNALNNLENIMYINDSETAQIFEDEWRKIWNSC